ncbi:response regulator [Arenibaculum pallidiluteum]|uniref:response regulator n=1 Tax=Arenibaculum pallidiluteum TaxID=2812559 RepID=UPI001A9685B3|nr:response regulator [Arenibaculum pallidiluteum]
MARILLVEDEALIGLAAKMALEEAGHCVLGPFVRVADALAAAEAEAVDLALVDISLAGRRNGLDAVHALERMGVRSILATSRHGLARTQGAPALGFLGKPYSGQSLTEAVAAAVALARGETPRSIPRDLVLFGPG